MAKKKPKDAKDALENILAQKVQHPEDFTFLDELSFSPEQIDNLTNGDLFWAQLVFKSLYGDMKAIQEILDRRFGKAPQHITQEVHTFTYTNFLDTIIDKQAQELQIDNPVEIQGKIIDVPQIENQESTEDRGSSVDTLLDDLGLL